MGRGWQATVWQGHEESDMTQRLTHSHIETIENSTYVYYFYKVRFTEVSKFYHNIKSCLCVCVRSVMSDSLRSMDDGRHELLSIEYQSTLEYKCVAIFQL